VLCEVGFTLAVSTGVEISGVEITLGKIIKTAIAATNNMTKAGMSH
jgi:hypothetical protein